VQLFVKAGITVNVSIHLDSWELLLSYSTRLAISHWTIDFTLDNWTSNKTMMQWLKKLLQEHDIKFDPVNQSVMCFGHIIDLGLG
jgi:hypothetical protein